MNAQLSKVLEGPVNNHEHSTPPHILGVFLKDANENFDAHLAAE